VVDATIMGSRIFLNDRDTGLVTPDTVTDLQPGSYEIRVQKGCEMGTALLVVEDQSLSVMVEMFEGSGTLRVNPEPLNASVEVDGDPQPSVTSMAVVFGCGEHHLKVSATGYLPAIIPFELGLSENLVVPVVLESLGSGIMTVNVQPNEATILMDGNAVGQGHVVVDPTPGGIHVIRAELVGYVPTEEVIRIGDGDSLDVDLLMEKRRGLRWETTTIVGSALLGMSLGTAAYAIVEYDQTKVAHDEYVQRIQAGTLVGEGGDAFYEGAVSPHKRRMYGAISATTGLLGAGFAVLVLF